MSDELFALLLVFGIVVPIGTWITWIWMSGSREEGHGKSSMDGVEYRDRINRLMGMLERREYQDAAEFRSICEDFMHKDMTTEEAVRLQRIIQGEGFLHPTLPVIVWFS